MQHLDPKAAHAYLQAHPRAMLIDCRTEIEHMYVGHPVGAEHVAWQEAPGQTKAPTKDGATLHLVVTASPTASAGFTTVLLTSTATSGTGAQAQTMWVQTVALTR